MRHNVKKSGLRLTKGYYKSLHRNLLTSLFKHDKIQTTAYRARTIAPIAEKMITMSKKKGEKDAIRYLSEYLTELDVSKKLVNELKTKFAKKTSGFTRTIKIGFRDGDAAPKVQIELIA